MDEKKLLKTLCESHGPSGKEYLIHPVIEDIFSPYGEISKDNLNNLYIKKKGESKGKIMIMAHCDEIFLMVTEILERGFLKVKSRGIDVKTLVSQEVVIHGKKQIKGVMGIKPPHLMTKEDREKAVSLDEILVDTGYSKEEVESIVEVGDFITINRESVELLNDNIGCKCADNRAGVLSMAVALNELRDIKHDLDVYSVCSVQEEVGARGAGSAAYNIMPSIGIVIDTTFHSGSLGYEEGDNVVGNGPVICIGPNIHPKVRKRLMDTGKKYNIPYQLEVEPGSTGTDAWPLQITKEGVPTVLISIPIKYMHSSVEVVNIKDINNTGRLIAKFIEDLKVEEVEGLICF